MHVHVHVHVHVHMDVHVHPRVPPLPLFRGEFDMRLWAVDVAFWRWMLLFGGGYSGLLAVDVAISLPKSFSGLLAVDLAFWRWMLLFDGGS